MRIGLFCTYENPQLDYASAFREQTELVERIEALGFEEAWIAEHHFNPQAASPSCLPILAYLAGRTSRIRLGSAAVLLPLHNPITVAEDVATVDILSGGRFEFGVAKGGPFPMQMKHFGVAKEEARDRTLEALDLIEALLDGASVTFKGRFYAAEGLELVPRPVQKPVTVHMASATPETVALAARRGYGMMAAPPFPLKGLAANLAHYRASAPDGDPRLTLIRFLHLADSRAQAVEEARGILAPFVERMRATTAQVRPDWTPWFELDRMIADSLIGTEADVAAQVAALERDFAPRTLVLKPLAPSHAKRLSDLETFAARIRPQLRAAA
ncbi:LLM class flavin-dependent oxidoreductase [Xanthobacter versatilis]|uniref:LLM class flavin-dependent oxidoreductase n=1 Tax=Xanthobacter autotrophicus (strain ATCC BAA-1158 / Py2) TaxID=78245 RepID=UPI00372669F0